MFGRKDSLKEFEQLSQPWKPSQQPGDSEGEAGAGVTRSDTLPSSVVPGVAKSTAPVTAELDEDTVVVSRGSIWEGSLKIDGSVHIEGRVKGAIEAVGMVSVAEGAHVDAKVRAARVVVAGEFQGEIRCTERLEIKPTGRVDAALTTKALSIHEGARLAGTVRMGDSNGAQGGSDRMMDRKPTAIAGKAGEKAIPLTR